VSDAQQQQNSFLAVRHKGALPKPYTWSEPIPESGAQVIVERAGGGEEVVVVTGAHSGGQSDLPQALAEVTPERLELLERRQQFEAKAFSFARQRTRTRRLRIKFVRCVIGADKKIRLFYASENTEDVRDLLRDFAHEFGVEVELVQLAPRSAAGELGGLGPCGRPTCCSTFLKVFPNPTTKMAKDQGISLTPQKLSGRCGKLKCCLAYEADTYREYLEEIALRVGHTVRSPKGYAKIIDLNIIQRKVRVATLASRDVASFGAEEVERVKGGIPQGDEKGGFFYGPEGKPERRSASVRVESKSPRSKGSTDTPKRSRRSRGDGSRNEQRAEQTAASSNDSARSSDNEKKPKRRRSKRRRRSKAPKSND
jgi:cell fate regulator YaaT (PSP1 superfamily)